MSDKDSLDDDLAYFNPTGAHSIVQRVFQRSCLDLMAGPMVAHVDEETMTGALLGAFAANAAWSNRLVTEATDGFSWIRYRKTPGAFDSETRTGADFALLVRHGLDDNRMAVFQAKRPDSITPKVLNVGRLSPAVDDFGPEPQFERLRRYGQEILQLIGRPGNADDMSRFYWMHYLSYTRAGLPTYSLDQLDDIRLIYKARADGDDEKAPSMLLAQLDAIELGFLLTAGAHQERSRSEQGWLLLNDSEAKIATKNLARKIPLVDVAPKTAPQLLDAAAVDVGGLVTEPLTRALKERLDIGQRWAEEYNIVQRKLRASGPKPRPW
ncbi:hypothetical protein [Luteibacter sp.]|uniref:hypothetical protein n=1 Tax=Luteibacter sp. TaxID=1886636 RepID=UPI002F414AC0